MAAEATGPVTMTDDGSSVIARETISSRKHTDLGELEQLYEIERTIKYLQDHGFTKVALQFPDELLADSDAVLSLLKARLGTVEFYILADTSYGSCCVDEVASQHVNAQTVVHYGHSCLSPTSHLPVLYVFGRKAIDVDTCAAQCHTLLPDVTQPILLMCNVEYAHAMDQIAQLLEEKYKYTQIIAAKIKLQDDNPVPAAVPTGEGCQKTGLGGGECCGGCQNSSKTTSGIARRASLPTVSNQQRGRAYELPDGVALSDCVIYFVGHDSLTLTNIMMVHNQCKIYSFDPSTNQGRQETVSVNRMLMKRYFMVQKAKDAMTIGIVVGTLGVASYMNIIEHLKKVITAAGRKWYFFVMGKLNVAKMANFMEIDCYVLVACPENSLIDSKEFYRPIVTPFELEIALVKSAEWTGDYVLDFSKLLPHLRTDGFQYDEEQEAGSSDEEGHFSLITGQYVSGPFQKAKPSSSLQDDTSTALTSQLSGLTLRNQQSSIAQLLNSTAGDYLQHRSYQGLDPNIGQDEASDVVEGRSGIARGYTVEK
ncbi:putative diphthamide synthesis protein-domain-containing protein [Gongronella butleri]|nr:putative diphthamide synthesis protein-domain-containing protein [Gongronella butleri]